MIHNTCIAAFRPRAGKPRRAKAGLSATPRATAIVDRDTHQCVSRKASDAAIPAFYTLCGYLVPEGNVVQTCLEVTCPGCLRQAGNAA
ncbi:MAG: hypothetical protein AB7O49_09110 [Sphingomonadales bacterium]